MKLLFVTLLIPAFLFVLPASYDSILERQLAGEIDVIDDTLMAALDSLGEEVR